MLGLNPHKLRTRALKCLVNPRRSLDKLRAGNAGDVNLSDQIFRHYLTAQKRLCLSAFDKTGSFYHHHGIMRVRA